MIITKSVDEKINGRIFWKMLPVDRWIEDSTVERVVLRVVKKKKKTEDEKNGEIA